MNGCRKSVKIRRGLLSRNETSTAPSSKRDSCQNVVLKLLYPWVGISVETAVMFDGMVMLETKRAKHACKPNTVQFGGSCDLLIPPQSLDQQLIPARCDAHVFAHLLVRHGLVANLTIFALVFKASGATHELSSILEQGPVEPLKNHLYVAQSIPVQRATARAPYY